MTAAVLPPTSSWPPREASRPSPVNPASTAASPFAGRATTPPPGAHQFRRPLPPCLALGGGDLRRRAPTGLPSSPRDPRPGPRVGARAVALLARPPPLRPHASPGRPARGRRMTIRGLTQDVSCEHGMSGVPVRRALIGVGRAEEGRLVEGPPDDLHADREAA